ncbi:putative ATPase [Kordia periserrulae]|uniref:Putative ATPase n=1 Tax=Kordia periserrulae TaxID=701523 RepID=A0A2T6BTZ3_9FLAO|nr:NB-ARC domain-containing protein [Kordia periserrulae]PTX59457.1 putative ATPase [Kordia periserrulae]
MDSKDIITLVVALIGGIATIVAAIITTRKKDKDNKKLSEDNQKHEDNTDEIETAREKAKELTDFKEYQTNISINGQDFFGRKKDLHEVKSLFLNSKKRLITITGTGGIGKTRFSKEIGLDLQKNYSGGVWFVDLTETTTISGIAYEIFEVFDRRHSSNQTTDTHAVIELLNHRGKTLLILDNFEQIVELSNQSITYWLDKLPDVDFLVTSRTPLKIAIEQQFQLSPLEIPDKNETDYEKIVENNSVKLFTCISKRVYPNFTLQENDINTLNSIVSYLEGLPLAIVIVASRIKYSNLENIEKELSNILNLSQRNRDTHEKHQTLYDTVLWSFNLLKEVEKEVFLKLKVFKDGFTLNSIKKIVLKNDDRLIDILDSLIENSLIYTDRTEQELRYKILIPIQEFINKKSEVYFQKKILNALEKEYCNFFYNLSIKHRSTLNTRSSIDALSFEMENILHTQDLYIKNFEYEKAAETILIFVEVLTLKGPTSLRIPRLKKSYDTLSDKHTETSGKLKLELIKTHLSRGEWSLAESLIYKLLENNQYLENIFEKAKVFMLLSTIASNYGFLKRSIYFRIKASEIFKMTESSVQLAECYIGLGASNERLKNYEDAMNYFSLAEEIAKSENNQVLSIKIHNRKGLAFWHHGKPSLGLKEINAALRLSNLMGNNLLFAANTTNKGLILSDLNRIDESLEYFEIAETFHRELRTLHWASVNYGGWGRSLILKNNNLQTRKAIDYIKNSEKIAREVYYPEDLAMSLGDLGRAYLQLEEWRNAYEAVSEAIYLERKMGATDEHRHFCNLVVFGQCCFILDKKIELWETITRANDLINVIGIDENYPIRKAAMDFLKLKELSLKSKFPILSETPIVLKNLNLSSKFFSNLPNLIKKVSKNEMYEYPWFLIEDSLKERNIKSIKLFGYGSLINKASASKTINTKSVNEYTLASGLGFKRLLNYNMPDEVRKRSLYNNPIGELYNGLFNVEYTGSVNDLLNGVMIDVTVDEFENLRKREIGYDLLPIVCIPHDKETDEYVLAYTLSCSDRKWGERNLLNKKLLPHKTYVDLCKEGAKKISKEFYEEFLRTSYLADGKTTLQDYKFPIR